MYNIHLWFARAQNLLKYFCVFIPTRISIKFAVKHVLKSFSVEKLDYVSLSF